MSSATDPSVHRGTPRFFRSPDGGFWTALQALACEVPPHRPAARWRFHARRQGRVVPVVVQVWPPSPQSDGWGVQVSVEPYAQALRFVGETSLLALLEATTFVSWLYHDAVVVEADDDQTTSMDPDRDWRAPPGMPLLPLATGEGLGGVKLVIGTPRPNPHDPGLFVCPVQVGEVLRYTYADNGVLALVNAGRLIRNLPEWPDP